MNSSDLMMTISEIAVALVGFSGVVAILGQRGRGHWSSAELLQLRTLVEPGLVALFGSLLPDIAQLAFESEVVAWRFSCAVLALLGVVGVVAFILRSRTAGTTMGQRILLVLAVLGVGAQLLVVGGVLVQYELVFVSGLVLALLIAAYNFLLLLFASRGAA